MRARVFLLGYNPSFLGAQGTQKSRKFAVNVSKRSRGFTMNLEQASRRVEPVRMFTRNGGNFYRVPAVTRNLPATIFRPRALLRKCTPHIYYVFGASWTFIFASVLHRSLLRHVCRRIDFFASFYPPFFCPPSSQLDLSRWATWNKFARWVAIEKFIGFS